MARKHAASIVRQTPFSDLPGAEREAAYRSVDREFAPGAGKPLTAAQRRELDAVRSRRRPAGAKPARIGRPPTGVTTRAINTTVDKVLLKQADAYAKKHGMKRTQLIAAGLRMVMANGVPAGG